MHLTLPGAAAYLAVAVLTLALSTAARRLRKARRPRVRDQLAARRYARLSPNHPAVRATRKPAARPAGPAAPTNPRER